MKIPSIGTKALLALASAVLLVPSSSEATLAYADGDVLLGFRATGGQGGSTSYLINLGSISQFLTADANNTILTLGVAQIGNVGTDLNTTFGSWQSRADVFWSAAGVQKVAGNTLANNTIFATHFADPGTYGASPWASPSAFGAGIPAGKVQSEGTKFSSGTYSGGDGIQTESGIHAIFQGNTIINGYRSFQPGGPNATGPAAYGIFNDTNGNGVEGNFQFGTSVSALDFYVAQPGTGTSDFIGQFTINSGGTVTFTPDGVPEPASLTALAIGSLVLASVRRRQARP